MDQPDSSDWERGGGWQHGAVNFIEYLTTQWCDHQWVRGTITSPPAALWVRLFSEPKASGEHRTQPSRWPKGNNHCIILSLLWIKISRKTTFSVIRNVEDWVRWRKMAVYNLVAWHYLIWEAFGCSCLLTSVLRIGGFFFFNCEINMNDEIYLILL